MKVYIVNETIEYCSSRLVGIYDTKLKAEETQTILDLLNDGWLGVCTDIEEWEVY